ncbi:NADH:ubiquinone oxidoreductase subunit [Rhizomicrobium palustre]|uniref:NADH:ubiquinone oxidoreductase subunit n=1 Tax=Rhizomicrobium palustre TaxID=189966 RepID=A0A846N0G7_9PROT|nr:NADH:ubiquinone oxidoreductase subunit NDUFA12 [Rhizomicrobium palustre]NIK89378.1 NADH:ubiquinone oxidoreductase subunit [Rhizomicrobium palustre]
MKFLWMIFSWWHGATIGTLLNTWFRGVAVGADGFGNRYYQSKDGKRRWVIYKHTVEGSFVPPEWHIWLHHTVDEPPAADLKKKSWEKDYLPNLSGTAGAYHPRGSLAAEGVRQSATGDYEAWSPNA